MGVDVITDFDVLNDMAYFTNIASRAAALTIAIQNGADTVFDFGQGDMAIFKNVTIAALAEAWT